MWFDGTGARGWLFDPAKAGGGPLFDIASHRIDVLNFLFGKPVHVAAQLSNVVHHYPVEDNATVMVEYESGVRGMVDVRWNSKIKRDECRIRGTEGEIEMSPLNGPELVYPGGRENLPSHENLHYPMIENFVDAVEGKAPVARERRIVILDGLGYGTSQEQVTRICHFAYSFFTTSPPFITNLTRSNVVTSFTGSPSTAMMSAHAPGSKVPTLPDQPNRSAAFRVEA